MEGTEIFDLTTVAGLEAAIWEHEPESDKALGVFDGTFCPVCRQQRRMQLHSMYWGHRWAPQRGFRVPLAHGEPSTAERFAADRPPENDNLLPAMYVAVCVQCDHVYVLVVHTGPDGIELAALPASYGGLATPNTHPAVAYYLDQANRARSLAAFSAAAAMYRAALDQLLFHEGFEDGMLGKKISDLEKAAPPPAWFKDLNPVYLEVINELGSGAIHPNDGDHKKQEAIDPNLTEAVDSMFIEILDRVYERPKIEADRLAKVKAATALLRKKKKGATD
jgi:hypothetical protein